MATTPLSPLTCTGTSLFALPPLPSSPLPLPPQAHSVPSDFNARPVVTRLAIAPTPVRLATWPGTLLTVPSGVLLPLPSCPTKLSPQAHTVPSALSARLWNCPAPSPTTLPIPMTGTGTLVPVVVEFPSWPRKLDPQAHSEPSDFNARLWVAPPTMPITPVRPLTCTGTLLLVALPVPSSPSELVPQAHTVP